jgi:DNA-binding LacI/PurR family transcriptional regulator
VLHAAHSLGLAIPADVSIVGFDDIPLASFTAPPLTTVHNPITEMAVLAVDVAIDRSSRTPGETTDHVLAPGFTVRATTGPAPS